MRFQRPQREKLNAENKSSKLTKLLQNIRLYATF